jgi:5-formyltetrahydrofolate cyclo-ligase
LKKGIRDKLLLIRDSLNPAVKQEKDAAVRERLLSLDEFKHAQTILFYASFRSEVDTIQLIKESLGMNKKIALPKVDNGRKKLEIYTIHDYSEVVPGYAGIPEPLPAVHREVIIDDIDMVVVPGAGFDIKGNRLGYGAGYYDRMLSQSINRITAVALAYEEQIFENIPVESHDVKVDMIVTDKRMIRCF